MDELFPTIHIDELFPSINMDELYYIFHIDELSNQSTWRSSSLLFTMTSSAISQHGRALLYYSHRRAIPSVNMDELYSAFHINELSHQSTWTSSSLLFTLTSSSHQSTWRSSTLLFTMTSSPINQHGRALLYYLLCRALPSVKMDELCSTIHIDELSHQSTWTSSTLLFTLTSSPISQHG